MYLLFVDESGTHGGSHAFVLGGLAVHESDAQRLQKRLDELVIERLGFIPPNLEEYELHATDLRNAKKPKSTSTQRPSVWAGVPRSIRLDLLEAAAGELVTFRPEDPNLPIAAFGVAVDARFRSDWSGMERERFTYEVLLNKFDVMLKRLREQHGKPNRGLVIHDRRVVAEQDIQAWTSEWRAAAGQVGQLRNLADVPLFTDSRATRLLQAADLISFAIYRRYRPDPPADTAGELFTVLWPLFDADGPVTHGCVHFTPSYGQGKCSCEACGQRLASASRRSGAHRAVRQGLG